MHRRALFVLVSLAVVTGTALAEPLSMKGKDREFSLDGEVVVVKR